MKPLEVYASVVLHSGCATPPKDEIEPRKHKWSECRAQRWYLRIARKHQHKLNSNGLCIGVRITEDKIYDALVEADVGGYTTVHIIEGIRSAKEDAHKVYEALA